MFQGKKTPRAAGRKIWRWKVVVVVLAWLQSGVVLCGVGEQEEEGVSLKEGAHKARLLGLLLDELDFVKAV